MDWTPEALAGMAIPEAAAQTLIAAHQEEMRQLQQRADETATALNSLRQLQAAQAEAQVRADKAHAVRQALREAGAAERLVPLLTQAVQLDQVELENGRLADPAAVLAPVRQAYPTLFEGGASLTPPLESASPLTREAIAGMSTEEINRAWAQVREALGAQ